MVIYTGKANRPHGQVVKTAPSHGAISGSNPLGVTSKTSSGYYRSLFVFITRMPHISQTNTGPGCYNLLAE